VFDIIDARCNHEDQLVRNNSKTASVLRTMLTDPAVGAFAKFQETTISFVVSVHPSVRTSKWNNSAPTGRIFMIFDI
jgi:hypothetical protein